jgi:hypothetical protein
MPVWREPTLSIGALQSKTPQGATFQLRTQPR